MLLGILGASLLGNILASKVARQGQRIKRARIVKAGYGNKKLDSYCRLIL